MFASFEKPVPNKGQVFLLLPDNSIPNEEYYAKTLNGVA
jgi:hypothetical protein